MIKPCELRESAIGPIVARDNPASRFGSQILSLALTCLESRLILLPH